MSAVSRAFLLSKIFGCFPFYLKNEELMVDYKFLAYSIMLKLFFAPQPIMNFFQASFVMARKKIHMTTATFSFIMASIFFNIGFFNYLRNRKILGKIFKSYSVANAEFKSLGEKPYESVTWYLDGLLLVIPPILTLIRYFITPNVTWYMVYQLAYLIHVMVSMYMLVHPFIRLVENLTVRMKRLRQIAQSLSECASSQKRTRHLESVIRLYDLLCSTSNVLNDVFCYNLLFVIFMVFFMITTYAYYSISNSLESTVALIQGFVGIFYGVIMCFIAIHSERLTKESIEFNDLLFKMMIKGKDEDMKNNKKLRLHILMKREVELNACGLFPLDHALIHSMIAAATTYLVILEDFGK